MAILKIVKFGEPTLRKISRPVDEITPRIKLLVGDMIDTMRAAGGCGLAAPQVGVLRRIAVIEVEEGEVYVLINPKIVAYAGELNGHDLLARAICHECAHLDGKLYTDVQIRPLTPEELK